MIKAPVVLRVLCGAAVLIFFSGCATVTDGPTGLDPSPSMSTVTGLLPSPPPPPSTFHGEVAYEDFDDWAAKDLESRMQACANFFASNPPDTDIEWSNQSTGMEIVAKYNAMFVVAARLRADLSDPRNRIVAEHIGDCMTSQRDEHPYGYTVFLTSLDLNVGTSFDDYLPALLPENVTRYSDGTSPARDVNGYTWIFRSVEGWSSGIVRELLIDEYEVRDINGFYLYRLVVTGPADDGFHEKDFGDRPPIVVG